MLFQIGPLQFDLRTNVEEYEIDDSEDFARKDVIGARKTYEHVGPGDDILRLRGNLFPAKFGGAGAIEAARQIKASGAPQFVIRGDGMVFGFYLLTKVNARGLYLSGYGAPRQISHDLTLERCDQPGAASAWNGLQSLFR